jgi:hypothetical protein
VAELVVGVVVDVLAHVLVQHRDRLGVGGIPASTGDLPVLDPGELVVLLPEIRLEDLCRSQEAENRGVAFREAAGRICDGRVGQEPRTDGPSPNRGSLQQERSPVGRVCCVSHDPSSTTDARTRRDTGTGLHRFHRWSARSHSWGARHPPAGLAIASGERRRSAPRRDGAPAEHHVRPHPLCIGEASTAVRTRAMPRFLKREGEPERRKHRSGGQIRTGDPLLPREIGGSQEVARDWLKALCEVGSRRLIPLCRLRFRESVRP